MTIAATLTRNARALGQYQALELNSRLEAAGPHRLVAILYEELLQSLQVLTRAAEKGGGLTVHPQADRARSILITLEASLDFQRGGALSESLAAVYRAMRKELAKAAADADREKLQSLTEGVETIASAWASLRQ